jgi:hypothetical protein
VALVALALSGLAAGAAGCGEGDGVSAGATVHVYVAAPLCEEAQSALNRAGEMAGDLRVKVVCLDPLMDGERVDLAAVGANARRATEDSTTVAFLEPPSRANRFAQPIVEEAGIAWVETDSGATATVQVLEAIEESGSGSLRDQVRKTLAQPNS